MSTIQTPPIEEEDSAPAPRRRNPIVAYIRPAVVITILFTIITGLIYPGVITGIAQLVFPSQANGSLVTVDGKTIGSRIIGEQWASTKYFHGRPSATLNPSGTPSPYEADNSSASNIGPTNQKLLTGNGSEVTITAGTPVPANATPVPGKKNTYNVPGTYQGVQSYAQQFRQENGLSPNTPLPSDIVTASGSGLDPDISVEAAQLQVNRIARARGLSPATVQQLINDHVQGRFLWIFGEPYVNVLDLNLALDGQK